ncbi:hypothetical protein GWI33_015221 [Rhynchophorus ferrugineus]|uniref:Uncharacterized protein n=1 Tax=Rhynchophorus ferrugineus TaxID=354439 RepID=A0A834M4Q8_RHYFE|nr:hypothetical protein GWI33_015221 [Rhynchophorus ferrugineus]
MRKVKSSVARAQNVPSGWIIYRFSLTEQALQAAATLPPSSSPLHPSTPACPRRNAPKTPVNHRQSVLAISCVNLPCNTLESEADAFPARREKVFLFALRSAS